MYAYFNNHIILYILIAYFFHLKYVIIICPCQAIFFNSMDLFSVYFLLTIFMRKSNKHTRLNDVNNTPMIEEGNYLSLLWSSASLFLSLEAVTGNMSGHLWEYLLLLDFLDCTVFLCFDDLWFNYFECFLGSGLTLCKRLPLVFSMWASIMNARTTSVSRVLI